MKSQTAESAERMDNIYYKENKKSFQLKKYKITEQKTLFMLDYRD